MDDVCSELDTGWSLPQPTTVSHDGEEADRSRARMSRCAPTGLRHVAGVVDRTKSRRSTGNDDA